MTADLLAENFSENPYWWDDAAPSDYPPPERHPGEDFKTDVLIVGSGYAGLSCALELATAGLAVTVVDAEQCGYGASTRAAGFLSGRAGVSKQINLEALVGAEHATRILDEADEAYEWLQSLVADNEIDCNLEPVGRFVGAHTPAAFDKLAGKMAEYNSDGKNRFQMIPRSEQHQYVASDYWYGGMFTENGGLIHSSRYHEGLRNLCFTAGVNIVTGSRVTAIQETATNKTVQVGAMRYLAKDVVIATNGYTDGLSPWHKKRLMPISSTVVASEEIGEDRVRALLPKLCPVIDTKRVVCYVRPSPDHRKILFGGRARFSPVSAVESATILHQYLLEMFPQMAGTKVTHAWSGYMAFTFDFLPKTGIQNGLHYAIGCNGGCGIVMMSWLGRKVARNILGAEDRHSAFSGVPFKSPVFYAGKPWFLPVVGNWWRFRDWIEIRHARHTGA